MDGVRRHRHEEDSKRHQLGVSGGSNALAERTDQRRDECSGRDGVRSNLCPASRAELGSASPGQAPETPGA